MNISSRKKLMEDAQRLLKVIREETEGVDSKVEKTVNKIKDIMIEKNDRIAALIELSKLLEEKPYTDILNSLHDIQKVYDKSIKDAEPIMVDSHYLVKYVESIQAKLMVCAGNKLNNKECAVIRSVIFTS